MFRKVGESAWPISEKDAVVSIKDASYPIPFPQGLEFNSPAHGCWNIVHTGMLIPEAHQIYVCADNCMRGVVLTAAEMHAEDRFSFVIVEEQNLLSGNLEDVTIEGTADILRKLKEREEKTGRKCRRQFFCLQYAFIIFSDAIWSGFTGNWSNDFQKSDF